MNKINSIYRQGNVYDINLFRLLKKCSFDKSEIDRILKALEVHGKEERFSWRKEDDKESKQK